MLIRARARVMWCGWPEQARGADNSDDDSSDDDEARPHSRRGRAGESVNEIECGQTGGWAPGEGVVRGALR